MPKKKRINPNRKPAHLTEADVKHVQSQAETRGLKRALALVLYTLVEKHDAPREDIQQLAREIDYMADSVCRGYVKWKDIDRVLNEEYGIEIELR